MEIEFTFLLKISSSQMNIFLIDNYFFEQDPNKIDPWKQLLLSDLFPKVILINHYHFDSLSLKEVVHLFL